MRSSLAVTLLSLLGAVSAAPAVGMTVAERDSSDLVERNVGGVRLLSCILKLDIVLTEESRSSFAPT